jgi:hypothetical protein
MTYDTVDLMHDVQPNPTDATHDVSVAFNWHLVRDRLPGDTIADRAQKAGIPLSTFERLCKHPEKALLRTVLKVRAATGLSLDDMISVTSQDKAA